MNMRCNFLYILSLFSLLIITNADLSAHNYIRTIKYCDSLGNDNSAIISTVYYDGLGRERLSVLGYGNSNNSVAIRTDYDTRGNIQYEWLPVPGGAELYEPKLYNSTASSFYGSNEKPYIQYDYELNGMNRPISEQGPGKLWEKHKKNITRLTNAGSGKYACKHFKFDVRQTQNSVEGSSAEETAVSVCGYYPIGSLRVECTTDEDGKEFIVFKDRLNRIILRRIVSTDAKYAETYFIYDDSGDLRYALTPEGSALLPHTGIISSDILDKYAQEYFYDLEHRCISAKAPGCGATHYVYDKLNRIIFESSATQREKGIWTLTKYDSQFRPAIKGTVTLRGKSREALQNEYGNSLIVEDADYSYNSVESDLGYPNTSGPSGFEPYIAWMYDNYDFFMGPNENEKAQFISANEDYSQKGLCTGILMKDGAGTDVYFKAFKYDHNEKIIRTCFWDIYLQNLRMTDKYEYDFNGNEIKHTEKYESIQEGSIIQETHESTTLNTYDKDGKLLTSELTVDGATPVMIHNLKYDGIRRLIEDASGSGIKYGYDIRSNLTEISSPAFSQKTWFGQTATTNSDVSFIFANASSFSWGKDKSYSHTEMYQYDGFGHFSNMESDNKKLSEKMTANLNADITEIVRKYNGDVVQDAIIQLDGCKADVVHDASTPYWADAVPSFIDGDYTLEYDSDGRLIKDQSRDISSIIYYPYANLPQRINATDGSYVYSSYFPDGTLFYRLFSKRTIEIITRVNSKGDTIRSERVRNITSRNQYRGSFEQTPDGWIYHTPNGYYNLAAKEHYWFVRDRLGSTVAVVDAVGNTLQNTGYYPSGTPYKIPNENIASEIDAATDKLHIGNRWIGHKGFNIYDNIARMHDPILARFHTIDPLYGNYPGHSPWNHCMANPLNVIDPTGMRVIYSSTNGDFLGVDETGYDGGYLVMDKINYSPGMSSEDANNYSVLTSSIESDILNKIETHFKNDVPNRPDYDGYITLQEAVQWYCGKSQGDLFADARKLDLSDISRADFNNGKCVKDLFEFKRSRVDLMYKMGVLGVLSAPFIDWRKFLEGGVYGHVTLSLEDNRVTIKSDTFDFDMHPWNSAGSYMRNIKTSLAKIIAGDGAPYNIHFYGSINLK